MMVIHYRVVYLLLIINHVFLGNLFEDIQRLKNSRITNSNSIFYWFFFISDAIDEAIHFILDRRR